MDELKKLKEENQRLKNKLLLFNNKSIFKNYFDYSIEPKILICTKTKKIIDANKAAISFYGYSAEKMLSLKIYDIHTLSKEEIDIKMLTAIKKSNNLFEFEHILANKEIRNVQVFVSNIKTDSFFYILLTIVDITEKIEQERELYQKQMLVKDIQQYSNIGYLERDLENNKYLWTNQVYEIFELDKKKVKANYKNFFNLISPDERILFFNSLHKISLVDTENIELETKLLLKNDKIKYIKISIYLELDAEKKIKRIFGTIQDITTAKTIELQLQEQNDELLQLQEELSLKNKLLAINRKRYRTLFKNNPISLWEEDFSDLMKLFDEVKHVKNFKKYLDDNNDFFLKCVASIKIITINEVTKKLFQIENVKDLTNHFAKNFNKKSIETLKRQFVSFRYGLNDFSDETEFVLTNKKILPAKIHVKYLEEEKKAIVSITNISKIKTIQKELILAKENAEKSNNLKSEFLHNLSHEIRTPMNGIIGFSDILLEGDVPEEKAKQYLKIIKSSGNQLLNIIDDILEISRLETKHVKIAKEEVCINNLLFELFSIFDIKAKDNKTPLYLNTKVAEKQSCIYSDATKINKIVSNLLENALKYTSTGHIEFGNYLEDENIIIYIKDTGTGINKDSLKSIFNRFSRENKHITSSVSGLGLGLSIAKENTELLGGNLKVKSIVGEGSTFYISIPYDNVYSDEKSVEITEEKNNDSNKKINILIAEDEEVNFLFIKILIQQKLNIDCKIIHVINGEDAINKFKNSKDINLILMDLKMPIVNGFDATREIRKFNSKVPIIAISAYSSENDINKALNAGCNDYISKPINKEKFKIMLKKIIDTN